MNKFFAVAVLLISSVFVGAGCVRLNLPSGLGGATVDFCAKHRGDAEAAIKKIAINDADKKAYEVWKQLFFKTNGINQDFFDKYIFASVDSRGSNYYINYYYKVGDIYLRANGDQIIVSADQLDRFQKLSVIDLLANLLPQKTGGFNEPHPTFGNVPRFGINNFDWGSVTVTKIKLAADGKTPPALVCQELVSKLKSCNSNIIAGSVSYKPALGQGWLYGDVKKHGDKECVGAMVSIFDGQTSCGMCFGIST